MQGGRGDAEDHRPRRCKDAEVTPSLSGPMRHIRSGAPGGLAVMYVSVVGANNESTYVLSVMLMYGRTFRLALAQAAELGSFLS